MSPNIKEKTVCVVGLGYVGLPLAESFSKHLKTIGFDIDTSKINKLKKCNSSVIYTNDPKRIYDADFIIIAVPTPLTKSKEPDLFFVKSAVKTVGRNMKKYSTIVLESTVYPGVTEEIVTPILEKESGLTCEIDFKIGYSPERVNPGDDDHTINKITKIVSGIDNETTNDLSELYGLITKTYMAENIKTAEAAKVIENIQRDLNIALINELTLIFHKMDLNVNNVLNAAATKWNFHKYVPGLVGGHCLPVDPYYLVYKSHEIGYHPQVILAGRSTNDYMPKYVAEMTIKGLNNLENVIKGSRVLIMGLTYKENVPDTRESPVNEIVAELKEFEIDVYGYDPHLSKKEIENFGIKPFKHDLKYDCIIMAVFHDEFKDIDENSLMNMMTSKPLIIDVKRGFKNYELKDICYKSL